MRVISAYLLAVLGGNASPSAADITKILSSGESPAAGPPSAPGEGPRRPRPRGASLGTGSPRFLALDPVSSLSWRRPPLTPPKLRRGGSRPPVTRVGAGEACVGAVRVRRRPSLTRRLAKASSSSLSGRGGGRGGRLGSPGDRVRPATDQHNPALLAVGRQRRREERGDSGPRPGPRAPANSTSRAPRAVGIEAEADQVKKLLSELEGKNVEDVIKEGRDKLQSVAAVAVPAAGGAAPAAGGAGAAKKEEKAPEPESEEEEMGLDLFG